MAEKDNMPSASLLGFIFSFFSIIRFLHEVKSHQTPKNKCDMNARYCNNNPNTNPEPKFPFQQEYILCQKAITQLRLCCSK